MRLFDLHCDTLMRCVEQNSSLLDNTFDLDASRGLSVLKHWVQVTAAFVPDGISEEEAWKRALSMLTHLYKEAEQHEEIVVVDSAETLARARTEHRLFAIPAVENGAAIGTDLERIRRLSQYGVAYMTVTWNGSNALGNGCMSKDTNGLTDFGKQAVTALYDHRILPDVSHLNEKGFWDVLSVADGRPMLATHSLSKAVCAHPRGLTDAQFCAIRDSGGLVGLNLCLDQLGGEELACVVSHLEHFLALGGEKTVALGLDLDGTSLPPSWNGIDVVTQLYQVLCSYGYPTSLIKRLFYENSYSFFEKSLTSAKECIRIGT